MRRTAFFDAPTRGGNMGLDGSRWVFEARGAGPGRYHLVDRWQPDHGDPFRRLCLRLAELGGVAGEVVSYG